MEQREYEVSEKEIGSIGGMREKEYEICEGVKTRVHQRFWKIAKQAMSSMTKQQRNNLGKSRVLQREISKQEMEDKLEIRSELDLSVFLVWRKERNRHKTEFSEIEYRDTLKEHTKNFFRLEKIRAEQREYFPKKLYGFQRYIIVKSVNIGTLIRTKKKISKAIWAIKINVPSMETESITFLAKNGYWETLTYMGTSEISEVGLNLNMTIKQLAKTVTHKEKQKKAEE